MNTTLVEALKQVEGAHHRYRRRANTAARAAMHETVDEATYLASAAIEDRIKDLHDAQPASVAEDRWTLFEHAWPLLREASYPTAFWTKATRRSVRRLPREVPRILSSRELEDLLRACSMSFRQGIDNSKGMKPRRRKDAHRRALREGLIANLWAIAHLGRLADVGAVDGVILGSAAVAAIHGPVEDRRD